MKVGELVDDFLATFDDGTTTSLSDLVADGPIAVFFYPKAFTPGCTAQACHFRDLAAEFDEVGARRFGVSRDDATTQAAFREKHDFGFPLIADRDGAVSRALGAKRIGPVPSKRKTVVIGTDRRVLADIASEANMEIHADRALEALRAARAGG